MAASPFAHRKMEIKQAIFTGKAARYGLPLLYCNQVGAQTELIFEGGSMAINRSGEVAARLPFFREDILISDLEELTVSDSRVPSIGRSRSGLEIMADALICGIRDYFGKMGFQKCHPGTFRGNRFGSNPGTGC